MGILQHMTNGLVQSFTIENLTALVLGVMVGTIFGAMPGLSATMALAVLLPLTYGLTPTQGIIIMGAAYAGAMYGGSISAILLNTPGTPAAAATCLDGHPMAKNGRASEALGMAALASAIGGIVSTFALMVMAPLLARFALSFTSVDYFLLAVLGLSIIITISEKSIIKGLASGIFGLFLSTIGMDPIYGYTRFTFGLVQLRGGLPLVPVLIGLLSTSQLFSLAEHPDKKLLTVASVKGRFFPKKEDVKACLPTILKSSVMGTVIGVVPGAGSSVATFLAYDNAKKSSKRKNEFGKGCIEGVAACEAANNAVSGGAMVPMLTLGVPGSNTVAVMMGALMLHGLVPGPELFSKHAEVAYTFIMSLLPANLFMLAFGLIAAKYCANIIKCPNNILLVVVMMLSIVGSFSVSNNIFNVYVMLVFGLIGYIFRKLDVDVVPMVLAFILGTIAEKGFRRALIANGGLSFAMFNKPISIVLCLLVLVSFALPIINRKKGKKEKR